MWVVGALWVKVSGRAAGIIRGHSEIFRVGTMECDNGVGQWDSFGVTGEC